MKKAIKLFVLMLMLSCSVSLGSELQPGESSVSMETSDTEFLMSEESHEVIEETVNSSIEAVADSETETTKTDSDEFATADSLEQIVDEESTEPELILADEYVTVMEKGSILWQEIDSIKNGTTASLVNQTFYVREKIKTVDGRIFVSLENNTAQKMGYVDESAVKLGEGKEGAWLAKNEYVQVTKKNFSIWQNFAWKEKSNTTKYYNKTFQVKGYYQHFNGSIYYSLYDGNGNWQGYVNQAAVTTVDSRQGNFIGTNKYVTIASKGYPIYSNFNWTVRHQAGALTNQTYQVKGYYEHLNGSTYYSLYNNKNKWMGYINKNAVKEGLGRQGAFIPSNDYASVTKNNFDVWQNFDWKKKQSSKVLYNQTYQVKGYYQHFNGSIYYSLYDNKGKWQGYLNKNGATKAPGRQGIWYGMNKSGVVTKAKYDVWQNFSWQRKGTTTTMVNKTYQVKGYYNHFNGSKYYSLYDNQGKWHGYVNANAVSFTRTSSIFFGTTADRVVNQLKSHEKDGFYIGTPYKSVMISPDPNAVMSPRGKPNKYGPGMNCAGFVSYAYRDGGADISRITRISNDYGGTSNAYNWRNALLKNTDYSTFSSVNQLLSSGKAKKGDIVYFEADHRYPGPDPHIGIFWGDKSNENRFFHATSPSTKISNIYSGTPFSKIYLFPL